MARYDSLADIPVSAAGLTDDWMEIMGVSSVGEHVLNGDGAGRPARELFQSLEIYLIRSGYEAIVSQSAGFIAPEQSDAENAAG
jgi:hypothetical protein